MNSAKGKKVQSNAVKNSLDIPLEQHSESRGIASEDNVTAQVSISKAVIRDMIESTPLPDIPTRSALRMAVNYIWMSSTPLPNFTQEAHDEIACSVRGYDVHPLSERLRTLRGEISSELVETGRVRARLLDLEEESLLLLYQNMYPSPYSFYCSYANGYALHHAP
ncbi:hypothetical protein BGZ83_011492 [Gryganskiella cystojenkinii]|nr:hypothetical protein BGZ83_011492 [Gryganskiella cystojenkinii]